MSIYNAAPLWELAFEKPIKIECHKVVVTIMSS